MRASLNDSLEFLFPDSEIDLEGTHEAAAPRLPLQQSLTLDVARGGTIAAHILLNDLPEGKTLQLSVQTPAGMPGKANWFRLVDVPVEENTGLVGFTERSDGQQNPHVIRRAPFRVYDAMAPVETQVEVTGPTMALRLELPVPTDAPPGEHNYRISLRCDEETGELSLAVNVFNVAIPPVGKDSLYFTNWFSLEHMAKFHGLEPWGEPHWKMIRAYADLMAHARQNTFLIPLGQIFRQTAAGPELDRELLERIVKTFTAAGLYYIEGGHVAGRHRGEWMATTFDLNLAQASATSIEGNLILARICRQLMVEIEQHGWRDRWLQHVADEPAEGNATDYRVLAGMLRRHMPGIPVVDAALNQSLAGALDIWCPQVQAYQKDREFFESQRAAGDRIWVYTCCFPGGPWLNRLLDQQLLRPALLGWACALYDLEGFLHWGLNQYQGEQNPFEQNVIPWTNPKTQSLPAGDTHIVYPGPDGPWSSLRLEAHREGLEDYELLRLLKQQDPEHAAAILRPVIRRFDSYTEDVKPFRAARRELLQALTPPPTPQ